MPRIILPNEALAILSATGLQPKDGSIRKLANIGLSRPFEHNNWRRRRAAKAGRR